MKSDVPRSRSLGEVPGVPTPVLREGVALELLVLPAAGVRAL